MWAIPATVDNRPGLGDGCASIRSAAAADGRTLLINTSAHAYSAAVATELPYDPIAAFVAVAPVTSQSYVLVAAGGSGIRGLDDLISAAEARALTFVSAGVGTGTHLPARPKDAISATIGRVAAGEADYAMSPISIARPHLADGTLTALGTSGAHRSQLLPHVPTLQEAEAAGFDFLIWYGIWAPSAAPALLVELNDAIGAALDAPELHLAGSARRRADANDTATARRLRHQRARSRRRDRQSAPPSGKIFGPLR